MHEVVSRIATTGWPAGQRPERLDHLGWLGRVVRSGLAMALSMQVGLVTAADDTAIRAPAPGERIVFLGDSIVDIGSVKAGHIQACITQIQAQHDFFARDFIRGGSQRDSRHRGKALMQGR